MAVNIRFLITPHAFAYLGTEEGAKEARIFESAFRLSQDLRKVAKQMNIIHWGDLRLKYDVTADKAGIVFLFFFGAEDFFGYPEFEECYSLDLS